MIPFDLLLVLDLSALHKDMFRMGNSTWPSFSRDRAKIDLLIVSINGVDTVMANGNGFSAYDHLTPIMKNPTKKIWKMKSGTRLDKRIRLVKDLRKGHEGHYMFAPAENMPLEDYLQIFIDLANDTTHCVPLFERKAPHGK